MMVADASVWVSHLIPQEVHHAVSRRWLKEAINSGAFIAAPALLLAEVAGAISRRTGDTDLGHKVVYHILSTPNLHLVHADKELGMLAAQLAADHRLRGADAVYVAVAHRLQVPLISWDKEQIDRAKALIVARTP